MRYLAIAAYFAAVAVAQAPVAAVQSISAATAQSVSASNAQSVSAAAVQSAPATVVQPAPAAATVQAPAINWVPILPLYSPSLALSTNGINTLANTLTSSAQNVTVAINKIVVAADLTANTTQYASANVDLIAALAVASDEFWMTAIDVEKLVCTIATSITQQNVASQISNLVVGIQAQAQVILQLQKQLALAISGIQAQVSAFSQSELAILVALIQAIAAAATASVAPVALLVSGLAGIGFTTITGVYAGLDASLKALASTAANVQFGGASVGT